MTLISLLKSKIHRATVTDADVDYVGSIAIDEELLELTGIAPDERVHIWDVTNGARLETYAIKAPRHSGIIAINGAAAHHVQPGHKVIIAAFCWTDETVEPRMVLVDDDNHFVSFLHAEPALTVLEG
ncbi:MAG TPA: aspartate 1-decarboxylase [Armatimonadota bacterium]|jgi:aspartate 1-decarboxylase